MRILETPNAASDGERRFRQICFEMLYACNLYCRHCYVGDHFNHAAPIVRSFSDYLPILPKIAAMTREISLVGGEPTLHPEFLRFLEYFKSVGVESVGFDSNGARVTPEVARTVAALGCWSSISVRGATEETFDDFAGKQGAHRMAFDAIVTLSQAGVDVAVQYDCTPETYDQLSAAVTALVERGAKPACVLLQKVISQLMFVGHWNAIRDRTGEPLMEDEAARMRFHLTAEQWNRVFEQARDIESRYGIKSYFVDDVPLCLVDEKYYDIATHASSEAGVLLVNPEGDVRRYFCTDTVVGNLFEESVEGMFDRLAAGAGQAPLVAPEACTDCRLREPCIGDWTRNGGLRSNLPWDGYQPVLRPAIESRPAA